MRNLCAMAILQNGESSFVTKFDQNSLILGDGQVLKKCDMRIMRCEEFTSQNMLESAENIIVTENGGYVCGRMFEICKFEKVEKINVLDQGVNHFFYQHNHGLIMHEVNNQHQIEAQQDQQQDFQIEIQGDMNNQQQQWQEQQDSEDQIQ